MHQQGAVAEVADVGCDIGARSGRAPGQAALLLRVSARQGLGPPIAMCPRRIPQPYVASLPTPKLSQTHSQYDVCSALSAACWMLVTVMRATQLWHECKDTGGNAKDNDKYLSCKAGAYCKDVLNDAVGVLLGVR